MSQSAAPALLSAPAGFFGPASGAAAGALPDSPPLPPTTTQTSWAPYSAVERTKIQAGFLYLLNAAEGLKALDPYWGQKFWQAVCSF